MALESHYRFLLWLVPAVERFPRSQKFLLGGPHPVCSPRRLGTLDRSHLHQATQRPPCQGQPRLGKTAFLFRPDAQAALREKDAAGNGSPPKAPALVTNGSPDAPETDPEAVLRAECAKDPEAVLRRECHKHSFNKANDGQVLYAYWSLDPSHLDDFRRQLAIGVRPANAARRQVKAAMALAQRLQMR